jgi:replicative DNA helicase
MSELKTPIVTQLADLVDFFVSDAEAAALARETGRPRGPVTGLSSLDEALGGYLSPGVHILQAAPGAGKTAFALQTASDCVYPCLYVTSEMGMLELFRRLIARQTKTFLGRLKSGELGGAESRKLALQTIEKLPNLAFMDATQAYASPLLIGEVANSLRDRYKSDHVLIALDSLQIWAKSARRAERKDTDKKDLALATEYDLISAGLDSVSSIASRLQCPILAISHRNRAGNKSDGGLHAGKGSGDLEYGAETVIDLTRKDETPDANGETRIKATMQKNRHGIPGVSYDFAFSGRLQTFRDV